MDGLLQMFSSTKYGRKDAEDIIRDVSKEYMDFHITKIADRRRRIDELYSEGNEENIRAETHLLQELKKQQNEFQEYISQLYRQLNTDDNTFLLNQFGLECKRFNNALPIYSKKSEIIQLIDENQVVIVTAETGSGKSTQIVQYLHQKYSGQAIVCTQPRKVAAISLAKRVSEELSSKLGEIVGYRVGGRSEGTKQTSIYFVTDHLLLNECLKDPLLSSYKYIIVDEAHERSIATDLLLSMIKKALSKRSELRLIISSATINPEIFMTYFDKMSINLHVHGRVFPVEEFYEEASVGMDYLPAVISKAKEIHLGEEFGDILVFLTTPSETEKAQETLQKDTSIHMDIECLVLHGRLQTEEQQKIFDPTPPGKRKIVFATNSAETSITVPNIRYVIDCGMVKEKKYDQDRNISLLKVGPINKSSAVQRKGRAGRTQDGKCFRLYTKEEFEAMKDEMLPEILRENLGVALLKLYQLGIENPIEYDFVEPPKEESLNTAMQELKELGAVEGNTLTRYGKTMASLTIEPKLGKFVALAIDEGFGMDAMVCAAICSVGSSVFFRGSTDDERQASDRLKVPFCHSGGDIMTILAVYKEWINVKDNQKKEWCIRNSMNAKTLRYTKDLVREMKASAEFVLNIRITDEFVQNADLEEFWLPYFLAECFKHNIAYFSGHARGGYFRPDWGRERFFLHPSSAFSFLSKTPKWIVFTEVLNTSRQYIINTTQLSDRIVEMIDLKSSIALHIDEAKIWTVGKATARKFGLGRWDCALEKQLQNEIHDDIYLDFNNNNGKVSLFSNPSHRGLAESELDNRIMKERTVFNQQVIDVPLSDGNLTSLILEKGGTVLDILEQYDFNAIILSKVDENLTKRDIEEKFRKYGTLSEVIQFKTGYTWGKVVYRSKRDAVRAVSLSDNDVTMKVKSAFKKGHHKAQKNQNFPLMATWTRRTAKGNYAFLTFADQLQAEDLFIGKSVLIGNKMYTFSTSKKSPSDVMVKGIDPYLSEEQLRNSIENQFPHVQITNSMIPRQNKAMDTNDAMQALQEQLALAIGRQINQEKKSKREFTVQIKPLNSPKDHNYQAKVSFKNVYECHQVESSLITVGMSTVDLKVDLTSSVDDLPAEVYRLIKRELNIYLCTMNSVKLIVENIKRTGDFVSLKVTAADAEQLSAATNVLQLITSAETLKFNEDQFRFLVTPKGKEFITRLQMNDSCIIKIEKRLRSVAVYGLQIKRKEIAETILKRAEEMDQYYKQYRLSLKKQPIGFIKILLRRYGSDLKKLYEESGASFLNINFLSQELEVTGSTESIQKAKEILSKINEDMLGVKKERPEEGDCPVCFGSLETTSHQLEICTHSYCKECVQMLVENGVRNKQLPLACVKEGCDKLISMQDITEFLEVEEVVPVAAERFIANNKDRYHYCITPNCLNIYQVSSVPNPDPFYCTVCETMICPYCHIKHHENIECKINERNFDPDIRDWLQKDRYNRGICPNCSAPIEKVEGCNHITCTSCFRHVCWRCKKRHFSTSFDCYEHMALCVNR